MRQAAGGRGRASASRHGRYCRRSTRGSSLFAVRPASRLARTLWWIVNLARQVETNKLGSALLTSPISNADQGDPGTDPPSYWLQAFVNGVTGNATPLPQGTVGGSQTMFRRSWAGLSSFEGYAGWYYNRLNLYQYGAALASTLGQYDGWRPASPNNLNWPDQRFAVPLLLTEVGCQRGPNTPANQDRQYAVVTRQVASTIEDDLKSHPTSRLTGYCLYSSTDEAWLKADWGLSVPGAPAYRAQTGTTALNYATWPSTTYPVETLSPVTHAPTGTALIAALARIFGSS